MNKGLEAFYKIKNKLIKVEGNTTYGSVIDLTNLDIIETALKRIDYLERVNKDLQELIEERNNKIIENRIVYDDYNFQSIKKFVACKGCQYYINEKCTNTTGCFWLNIEKELKALEIIREKDIDVVAFKKLAFGRIPLTDKEKLDYWNDIHNNKIAKEEYDLLKEALL